MKVGVVVLAEEGLRQLHDYLNRAYGGWKQIVRTAVEKGVEAALRALTAVKEEVLKLCRDNKDLIETLTKFAVKTTAREVISKTATKLVIKIIAAEGTKEGAKVGAAHVVKIGVKETVIAGTRMGGKGFVKAGIKETTIVGTKNVVKAGAKQTASLGTKGFIKSAANPVGIASDLAQAVLEYYGYKEEGKKVGKCGNIVAGAMTGGAIAGPPGAAVGALAGFAVWGVGEVVGGLVDRAFGE